MNQSDAPYRLNAERSLVSHALRQNARVLDPFFKGDDNLPDALEKLAGNAERHAIAPAPVAASSATTPTPAASRTSDLADAQYEVTSALQLSIIDSVAMGTS
jgi:hypothetical protein